MQKAKEKKAIRELKEDEAYIIEHLKRGNVP
jgi:hypothetical protein